MTIEKGITRRELVRGGAKAAGIAMFGIPQSLFCARGAASDLALRPYRWSGCYADMRSKLAYPHDPGLCADVRAKWMGNQRLIIRSCETIGYDAGLIYQDHDSQAGESPPYRHPSFRFASRLTPNCLSASCLVKGTGTFAVALNVQNDYVDIDLSFRNLSSKSMDFIYWAFCVVAYEAPSIGLGIVDRLLIFDGNKLIHLPKVSKIFEPEVMYLVKGGDGFVPPPHRSFPKGDIVAQKPIVIIEDVDRKHCVGLAFQRGCTIFASPPNSCFHVLPYFGTGIAVGTHRAIKGRLYFAKGSPDALFERYLKDFASS